MKYNLLGQRGPEGQTNPAATEGGPYIYDGPPGVGDNKGLNAKGSPVDEQQHKDKVESAGVEDTTTSSDDTSEDTSEDTTQETQDTKQYSSSYTVEQIMDYQTILKGRGFYTGAIDGIIGPATKAAAQAMIDSDAPQDIDATRGDKGKALAQALDAITQTTGLIYGSDLNSGQTSTAETTTQDTTMYWGRYDSGSWFTSTLDGIEDDGTWKWGWELPEYEELGQDAFTSDKDLNDILKSTTDGAGAGASAEEVTSGVTSGSAELSTGFVDSQIWEYQGNKFVVWQVPETMMYMRYAASDSELDMLYSGRERPDVVQASDTMWTSSVFFGNVNELDDKVITTGDSPFVGFLNNFEKATLGRPWLKSDDEMFALWVEGYVENRDITTEEWSNTEWWNNSTKEERDWLVTSKGRGIGDADFPADAKTLLDQNRILYLQTMKNAGIANADTIRDANGNSLAKWFADKVTFGEFDAVKASEQIQALSDVTSGIQVDERITNWLEGKGEVDQTKTGYAAARALALEWLGPVYGALDEATLQDYAGIIRNAENPDVGADLLQQELKAQRKVLFNSDIYDENLTYKQIAAPWQNYSFQFLGERIDETSENWLNVLLANDQNTAVRELTAYGLNNNIAKVVDNLSDSVASSVGVSETGVQRGFST